jgi:hypothetical protein
MYILHEERVLSMHHVPELTVNEHPLQQLTAKAKPEQRKKPVNNKPLKRLVIHPKNAVESS